MRDFGACISTESGATKPSTAVPEVAEFEASVKAEVLRLKKLALFGSTVSTSLGNMVFVLFFSLLSLVEPADFDVVDLGIEQ